MEKWEYYWITNKQLSGLIAAYQINDAKLSRKVLLKVVKDQDIQDNKAFRRFLTADKL